MLRPYFKFDRALYPKLSQCAYEAIRESFQAVLDNREVIPGMITGIHTFGNFLNPHLHIHSIFSQGCFDKKNTFHLSPDVLDEGKCTKLFMHKVLKMLLEEEKITDFVVEKLQSWTHSGFNVYFGDIIAPSDRESRERVSRYLTRQLSVLIK